MNVLIGVDESPFSAAAIDYVKRLPWRPGTTFRVVSACPPMFLGTAEVAAPSAIAELIRQQESHHKEVAERAAGELRKAGLEAEGLTIADDPRSGLEEEARRTKADLVVLGSHGRTGLTKLLLGSVASHVVGHAPCSVLVVRPPRA
jgi:nucleotide-binding universal stress UspA family protein